MRSGPRWLWLGVAWMVHDCVASIRAVPEVEMPERERGSSSGGNSGGSRDASGVLAVLVDKFSLRFFKFQRGELVVLRSPEEPERRLVRRLVAVEEDHVAVAGPTPGSRAQVERIPKGHCWCEADAGARAVGGDSRLAWGPVPLALIEGRVTRVLWPPSRWGVLPPQPSLTRVVGKGGTLEFLQPPAREQDWWS